MYVGVHLYQMYTYVHCRIVDRRIHRFCSVTQEKKSNIDKLERCNDTGT